MKVAQQQLFVLLDKVQKQQMLRSIDVKFAQWLARQLPDSSPYQLLLSALVSYQLADGHVCLNMKNVADTIGHWPAQLASEADEFLSNQGWAEAAVDGKLIADVQMLASGTELSPLVIDNNRLYLYRYWQYECKVAAKLMAAVVPQSNQQDVKALDPVHLKSQLDRYFSSAEQPDWQRVAAAITTAHRFSVISGGPGTGKTTTVTKLLAIYIESQLSLGRRPIIQLAAPTGKAAARLSESIAAAKVKLDIPEQVLALIPEQGKTIHRLLGARAKSNQFIHNADNPLLADLLVIDEASMIDLPMMANIVAALSEQTRLILIGDRDQLASVEAGSVLGDICAVPNMACYSRQQADYLAISCGFQQSEVSKYPFADQLAFLQKSYRFSATSGIGALAKACNEGDSRQSVVVLQGDYADLQVIQATADTVNDQQILAPILKGYQQYISQMGKLNDPKQLLTLFNQFQVLCAMRVGSFGVERINQQIEEHFQRTTIKDADNRWYVGRPIMITRNDNPMQLYNGDIGVTCYDEESGQLKVWFEQGGVIRGVLPSRLPQHETVFAMTVHKSQGSEFDHVMFLLAQNARVVNKELIYTAITRAKNNFTFFGNLQILKQAVTRSTLRSSGLADKIWC